MLLAAIPVDRVSLALAVLTVVAQALVVVFVGLALRARSSSRHRDLLHQIARPAPQLAATVALTATLGSLYFSEIADFTPCVLCWYQRICMYPLVLVLAAAAIWRPRGWWWLALPQVLVGAAISVYHYQLERFPNQHSLSCEIENPCTLVWIWKFGYISIPMMALSAFLLIATLLLIARWSDRAALATTTDTEPTTPEE